MSTFRKNQQITSIILKANEFLKDAEVLLDQGRFAATVSRSYYAIFHALQAVLLSKDLAFSKHSGVIGAFSRHFIKEKIFPVDCAKKIKNVWKERELSDYGFTSIIDEAEAEARLNDAKKIVTMIKEYLQKHKHYPCL